MNNKQLEKIRKGDYLLLPHYMKWVSIMIIVLGILLFFGKEQQEILDHDLASEIAFHVILLGLLFIILSKDRFPDERLLNLRHKAMAYAFMNGMIIVIIVPLFNFLLSSILHQDFTSSFLSLGSVAIIIFQFLYLLNYWRYKREL